jgi:protein-S-isoprenylcysteine O-methyltransferase Ste14
VTEVANAGLVRPPLVYLGSTGVGLVAHVVWPLEVLPALVSVVAGATVTLLAAALFISAVLALRRAGTPVPGDRATTVIVRAGPYGFSRNPIYLAFTLCQVGIGALVNSAGVLLALVPALALMDRVVIPREERYLGAVFLRVSAVQARSPSLALGRWRRLKRRGRAAGLRKGERDRRGAEADDEGAAPSATITQP